MDEERLREQCVNLCQLHTFLIELGHLVEIQILRPFLGCAGGKQIARLLLPLANLGFVLLFLLDEADAIDTLVHANGVFPIVAGIGIL